MRLPLVSAGTVARAAGLVAAIAIGIAALLHAVKHEPAPASQDPRGADTTDAIAAELVRCQNIGLTAQDDSACLSAWTENRRRFFGAEPPAATPARPADGMPLQQPDR